MFGLQEDESDFAEKEAVIRLPRRPGLQTYIFRIPLHRLRRNPRGRRSHVTTEPVAASVRLGGPKPGRAISRFIGKTLPPPWHSAAKYGARPALGPEALATENRHGSSPLKSSAEMSLTSVYAREYKQGLVITFPGIRPPKVRLSIVGLVSGKSTETA